MKNNKGNRTGNRFQFGINCYNRCTCAAGKQYTILTQVRESPAIAIGRLINKEVVVNYLNNSSLTFLLNCAAWREVKNNKQ